jgi:MFS family permease
MSELRDERIEEPAAGLRLPVQDAALVRLRHRTLALLVLGQVLGGFGIGAAGSVGALAVSELAGEAWSGAAAVMSTLGAAMVALPLARLADRSGRRVSLSSAALAAAVGAAVCVVALTGGSPVLLLLGLLLLGAATAGNLQSRFAATDLASAGSRGRDLSLVVWSTTLGAVVGPNLAGPGSVVGAAVGLPVLAGVFLFPVLTQILAAAAYLVGLRPDPLLESRRRAATPAADDPAGTASRAAGAGDPVLDRVAIATVALSHATMVALMAMTPVHLVHGGASLSVVGFTLSLHIAGMFALSPVFGLLVDRWGSFPVIVLGQTLLLGAAVVTALAADDTRAVMTGLVLLGLGWSASTVAGSSLLNSAAPADRRIPVQGRSDLAMNLAGASGGAVAGPLLAVLGYSGLAWLLLVPVAAVLAAGTYGVRRSRAAGS